MQWKKWELLLIAELVSIVKNLSFQPIKFYVLQQHLQLQKHPKIFQIEKNKMLSKIFYVMWKLISKTLLLASLPRKTFKIYFR